MNRFELNDRLEAFKKSLLDSFTEEQANFIAEQRYNAWLRKEQGENLLTDEFENEMWYAFNQTDLFPEGWDPDYTRMYISDAQYE